jgi:hypothetical protein
VVSRRYHLNVTVAKLLILIGGVIIALGILIQLGLPIGRLPGDIRFTRGSFTFYSPLATALLISVVLTIVLNLLVRR